MTRRLADIRSRPNWRTDGLIPRDNDDRDHKDIQQRILPRDRRQQVQAFSQLGLPLRIIGSGRDEAGLRAALDVFLKD